MDDLPLDLYINDPKIHEQAAELAETYWDLWRGYSPADLDVLLDRAERLVKNTKSSYDRAVKDDLDDATVRKWRREYKLARTFRRVLRLLIKHHFYIGPDIPPYEEARPFDVGGPDIGAPAPELPPKTEAYLQAATRAADNPMSVGEIVHEVAEAEDVSESTAYKWLCDKNPLYEANAPADERLKMLRDMMDELATSRF